MSLQQLMRQRDGIEIYIRETEEQIAQTKEQKKEAIEEYNKKYESESEEWRDGPNGQALFRAWNKLDISLADKIDVLETELEGWKGDLKKTLSALKNAGIWCRGILNFGTGPEW